MLNVKFEGPFVVYAQANELDDRLGELISCIFKMWSGRKTADEESEVRGAREYKCTYIYKVDGRGLGHGCQTYHDLCAITFRKTIFGPPTNSMMLNMFLSFPQNWDDVQEPF